MLTQLHLQLCYAALTALLTFPSPAVTSVAQGNATWPYQTYKSANFTPPQLEITYGSAGCSAGDEGYLFIATDGASPDETASLIMDWQRNNSLVWQGPLGHAFNFRPYTYRGKPVLAYWNGSVFPEPVGRGNGAVHILDNAYEEIAVVTLEGTFLEIKPGATYPSNADLHEIYITDNGTLLVTANNVTQTDLTSVGGPADGWAVDCLIYAIDIATNAVLFRWSSLEHLDQLPLSLSVFPLGSEGLTGTNQSVAWGYFHINAVSPFEDGYLISTRYLCSGIAIAADGSVKWRLQGRDGGDFTLGNGTNFCYQHDIRAVTPAHSSANASSIVLHLHDNANCPIDNGTTPTSGLLLNVDLENRHASLIQRYRNPADRIFATAQGNYEPLPNSDVFLGHGFIPVSEQFSHAGDTKLTVQYGPRYPAGTFSYRSFRQPWVGCPKTRPSVFAEADGNATAVYVSWNGATQVEAWDVYGGEQQASLKLLARVPKAGFETEVLVDKASFVQVKARTKRSYRGWSKGMRTKSEGCVYGSSNTTSEVVIVA